MEGRGGGEGLIGCVVGYHCETEEEFAEAFEKVLGLGEEEVRGMRERARRTARRFDEETFEGKWLEGFETLVGK